MQISIEVLSFGWIDIDSSSSLPPYSQVDTKVKGLTLPHVRNEGSDTSDSVRSVRPYILNHTFCGKNTKMLVFPLPFQNRHLESLYFW